MPGGDPPTRQIDPPILERLGEFVVVWSLLESMVADLFVATIKSDIGNLMVVTQGVSANTISGWIRTSIEFRYTPPDEARQIREILDEYDKLRAERNALIHGLWGTDKSGPGTALVQTVRLGRRTPIVDRLITVSDLDDLIDVTLGLYAKLLAFMRAHGLPYRGG